MRDLEMTRRALEALKRNDLDFPEIFRLAQGLALDFSRGFYTNPGQAPALNQTDHYPSASSS
jgi:hypothetical protein